MQSTPWARKLGGGSMPSDRIRNANAPRAQPTPKASPKTSAKNSGRNTPEPPKSDAVKKLETLLEGVKGKNAGIKQDPKGGCFCLARVHALSPYNPLCHSCGFILCALNQPQHSCPSCTNALFTPSTHPTLISRLEQELTTQLAKEENIRAQIEEDARNAVGAFPTLANGPTGFATGLGVQRQQLSPGEGGLRTVQDQPKVLSLTGKRAKISTLGKSPAASRPSTPASGAIEAARAAEQKRRLEEMEMGSRIAKPADEVVHASRKPAQDRPWEDVRGERRLYYVPLPQAEEIKKEGSRRRNKGKGKATGTVEGDAAAGTVVVSTEKGKDKAMQ